MALISKRDAMTAKARELLGCGYIYGATGWICTRARMDQQAAQYPEYANLIYRYGPRWIGRPCYDCAQLTRVVAREAGIRLPSGSNIQWMAGGVWREKGTLQTLPDEAGLFLFTRTGARMTHTGVSIGHGEEIDARGHAYGVVQRRIADTSFTHWARLAVAYDAPAQESPAQMDKARRTISYGMRGADVKELQERLIAQGYSLSPYGADGYFGAVTQEAVRLFQQQHGLAADGIAGPKTWTALLGMNAQLEKGAN